jgi:hypothetical protein
VRTSDAATPARRVARKEWEATVKTPMAWVGGSAATADGTAGSTDLPNLVGHARREANS